ncbi:hypothetical protein [Coraliomargarita parva]|uniref:hypothetical protein n=1 Tax=Coraliomargarita parva TaxID=3014050 RepID=UPI0022B3F29D|nr:hypothetical protein [Coraliomargarita parva]
MLNLQMGWLGFVFGVLSGVWMGMRFHDEAWLGGYGSYRRRMLRLGHIACFGMGLLNVLYALSLSMQPVGMPWGRLASWGWLLALMSMPLCCWLTAWRKGFRHLFPVPVLASVIALASLFTGWRYL